MSEANKSALIESYEKAMDEFIVKIERLRDKQATKRILSGMVNSYCLEKDYQRRPAASIVSSLRCDETGKIIRVWIIRQESISRVVAPSYLDNWGINSWIQSSDEYNDAIRWFYTPEEAYDEWIVKHRDSWMEYMKKLGWKFWRGEE